MMGMLMIPHRLLPTGEMASAERGPVGNRKSVVYGTSDGISPVSWPRTN